VIIKISDTCAFLSSDIRGVVYVPERDIESSGISVGAYVTVFLASDSHSIDFGSNDEGGAFAARLIAEWKAAENPKPPTEADEWAGIAPEFKWMATDDDGETYFFTEKPEYKPDGVWRTDKGSWRPLNKLRGKNSLRERPQNQVSP
jgi:hypothetical protein